MLHARSMLMACGDPRATLEINRIAPGAGRLASLKRSGPCFTVTPDQSWERIAGGNGLVLLRRVPVFPGEPPLFFRSRDLVAAAAPASRGGAAADGRIMLVLLLAAAAWPIRLSWALGRGLWAKRAIRRGGARALAVAVAEIEAQRTRLQVRRMQLVIPDSYGTCDMDRWTREKLHFANSRIRRRLAEQGLSDQWPRIAGEVDRRIEQAASAPPARLKAGAAYRRGMDPIAYERHCAQLLRSSGWVAQVTPAGGDQGTDIVAHRGKRSMVLQCKLYGRPVGNSAVQQVAAARAHHRADFAAVVSNADFTSQARQLAATNEVYLLHHEELRDFMPSSLTAALRSGC